MIIVKRFDAMDAHGKQSAGKKLFKMMEWQLNGCKMSLSELHKAD